MCCSFEKNNANQDLIPTNGYQNKNSKSGSPNWEWDNDSHKKHKLFTTRKRGCGIRRRQQARKNPQLYH